MDRELNRSVRILEDSLTGQSRSLLRTPGTPKRKVSKLEFESTSLDLSLTIDPDEMSRLISKRNVSFIDETLHKIVHDQTMTGSIITTSKPWVQTTQSLYTEFFEIIQARTNIAEIFETVLDLTRCCTDTLQIIKNMKTIKAQRTEEKWLENERNTWRLIYCLYQDRLNEVQEANVCLGVSEKLCVENLYKRDSLVRESQLIIDWLECNALERETEAPKIQHFTDKTFGWENTLHQLVSSDNIVFKSSRQIVTNLDPDAPIRENLPLHDLDAEDDDRLCKRIFMDIRCGQLETAQKTCVHCGHPWRASLLEGWRLHHNPNLKYDELEEPKELTVEVIMNETAKRVQKVSDKKQFYPIEGNVNRDIWKIFALKYCEQVNINIFQRATVGAFCGHLPSLLAVSNSWEDQLWSYMKTLVDIRVESEVRDYVSRKYKELPGSYWDNRMSLDEVFEKLSASKDSQIMEEASSYDHIIQKYIILDQIPQLIEMMGNWIDSDNVSAQFLRFIAHLVLFFKQIGIWHKDDIGSKILEFYVKKLMEMKEIQLVPYYVSTLGRKKQIQLYAAFLENIKDDEERKESLQFAENVDLDVKAITKQIVENIRNKMDDINNFDNLQKITSELDLEKISALDWLLYHPSQRVEMLFQCNALISYFLTIGKIEAAKMAFAKIPVNSLDTILMEDVPKSVHEVIREHLSYKAYLDSHEAFNDWFKYFYHSKPTEPAPIRKTAAFTEKVAHEHRLTQHHAEVERWKITVTHLAKTAKTMLYNVLLFPDGGWLCETNNADFLRNKCIPEIVLLLYTILWESEEYSECLQLADLLASNQWKLYTFYNKNELSDILRKIFNACARLLEMNKDMWGGPAP